MSSSAPPVVADSRSRVGLLVMDGLLVVLMSWLLYVVVADRGAAEASNGAETVVENADGAVTESADGAVTEDADGAVIETGREIDGDAATDASTDGPEVRD
ncbi:hypothetical protein Pla163_14640 [Planctomycetes bacterium Pla163]|uniref:Uncharacterized protein n=1 Tax=Rohdeia mirabilis TaxID=2528008 RepID=A0A518CYS1_9BACT|nr:hypothetical protein Pla163_14640 [Planctomycetes bacterium Pla163]